MKTEDLKALGLNDEQVQRVFAMNGADVNREKQAAETAKAERDAMRTQLDEANTKLKGYDPDWQQKAADTKPARIVASATGTPAAATGREEANAAIRAAFGK